MTREINGYIGRQRCQLREEFDSGISTKKAYMRAHVLSKFCISQNGISLRVLATLRRNQQGVEAMMLLLCHMGLRYYGKQKSYLRAGIGTIGYIIY